MSISVKRLLPGDEKIKSALSLAKDVFMEFEAPVYPKEGVDSFLSYVDGEKLLTSIDDENALVFAAFSDDVICGMMAVFRNGHISLAFVSAEYHRQGIGSMLFGAADKELRCMEYTVNSSPFGTGFYKKLGFCEVDMEQISDGIIFTPMKLVKK